MKYKELINMINKEDYKNALYLIDNYIHLSNDEKNGKEDIDINKIKNYISMGKTYEVNYTYPSIVYTDCNDDYLLYKSILKHQKTNYNAYIKNEYETILSFNSLK